MSIYKANDIRGIYGTELQDNDAYALGNAFVRYIKAKRIAVGRDNRVSSPALHDALVQGIVDAGADVLDIGEVDSPALYFATSYLETPGIMITASHNPAEYNGFYVCGSHATPLNEQTGLKALEAQTKKKAIKNTHKGAVYSTPLMRPYTKHVLSFLNHAEARPFTVVIDAGNGMGAQIATRVFKALRNVTVIPLYYESDGRFPHHGPDPSKIENLQQLGEKVLETEADFGIALDGDADRAGFVDENGEPIEGSLVGALLAQHVLSKHPKEKIVYSSTCSRVLPETIIRAKGVPLKDKVGHTFIKYRMRKEHALFGIENTGHYMYRDNDYADSGIITAVLMCQFYAAQQKTFSALVKPLKKYYKASEYNINIENARKYISLLHTKIRALKPQKINLQDGIAADFGTYWISIRASQTEPLMRLVVEGKNKDEVENQRRTFAEMIKKTIQC
ncbi:MAG: phosphomannomutase/phosphoglucomutase [Nanoarchaeota archaeon]